MGPLARVRPTALIGVAVAALVAAVAAAQGPVADPLKAEIARWSSRVADATRTDEMWVQARTSSAGPLAQAAQALQDGRRWYALDRFAAARGNLAAAEFVIAHPADARDSMPAFEAAWTRSGTTLRASVTPRPPASTLANLGPAAVRAEAEAALAQVRVYYESSLQFGRNTSAASGYYYLGLAEAQQQFVTFVRTLATPPARPLAVRALTNDIGALQTRLLTAYVPPASIDRHAEFIAASAAIKEARELDRLGYRYGALLKYLGAVVRVTMVLAPTAPPDKTALTARVAEWRARVTAMPGDHSLADMLVERAEVALATPDALPIAAAITGDALPRYVEALAPASAAAARPVAARVTVTLVRWPYT